MERLEELPFPRIHMRTNAQPRYIQSTHKGGHTPVALELDVQQIE